MFNFQNPHAESVGMRSKRENVEVNRSRSQHNTVASKKWFLAGEKSPTLNT